MFGIQYWRLRLETTLSGWQWDYPVGAGEYAALYPKSWYDYKWDQFPAHVVLEQFSPVLPDNYRESSYPVAVYRWHAENPTNKAVTVSVLLSWTNMVGWFRTFTRDFQGTPNQGDHNEFASEKLSSGVMRGIVFDRNCAGTVRAQRRDEGRGLSHSLGPIPRNLREQGILGDGDDSATRHQIAGREPPLQN